jgi:hypothetical protein
MLRMTAYGLRELFRRDYAVSFAYQVLEDLAGSLVDPFSAQWAFRREHFRAPKSEDAYPRLSRHSCRRQHAPPVVGRMAHFEYQARTVVTERRDADPQRSRLRTLYHGLQWTSAGADRLVGEAAVTRAVRRATREELAARPSENTAPELE